MNKNNYKKASVTITIIIIVILLFLAWFFIPKSFLDKGPGNRFGNFQQPKSDSINDSVPSALKWTDSFGSKKEEKRQGSYIHYLSEKNKNK